MRISGAAGGREETLPHPIIPLNELQEIEFVSLQYILGKMFLLKRSLEFLDWE